MSLLDPRSYTQLISTRLKLRLSGTHNKVREQDLAQKTCGRNNSHVFLKGVICECKRVEHAELSFLERRINFGLPGNGKPRKALTKRKMGHKFKYKTHFH